MKFHVKNSKAAKLTASQVIEIRRLYAESDATQGQIARDFEISAVQVGRILRGESWQQLPATMPTREEMDMSARRLYEMQEARKAMSPQERMARDVLEEQQKHPDAMVKELQTEEREATETEMKAFKLGAALPPGVRLPKGSPD